MKRKGFTFLLTLTLALGAAAQNVNAQEKAAQEKAAQDKGMWHAVSKTAASITGDVTLEKERIEIGHAIFPIVQVRSLKAEEAVALFSDEAGAAGSGNLYGVSIPATQKFQNKNTLCGNDEAEWIVSYASGRTLQLVFFSGKKMPEITVDALNTTTSLCGTFTYSRYSRYGQWEW